jgi:hypothetical protein
LFQAPPREGPLRSWLLVGACTLLIYSAIPLARPLLRILQAHGGGGVLRWFSLAVIVAAAAIALVYLYRRLRKLTWIRLAWLIGVVGYFSYLVLEKMKTPSEALHFLEYGLLGLLALRALSHRLQDKMVYLCAVLVCLLVGTVDEILQWLTPGRIWDLRDIAHNGVASLMAQLAVAGGLQPPFIRAVWSPRSVRWFCALSAVLLLLLGCCASNTPVGRGVVQRANPGAAFLKQQDNPMVEYGYRYDDPAIGRFYSRFRRTIWRGWTSSGARTRGRIIHHYWNNDSYSNFLRRYTPATDPFVHEANVHIYRRNHYRDVMWSHQAKPEAFSRHVTVAVRENQIVERYYSNTLAASGERWPAGYLTSLYAQVRSDRLYKSEVSRHLITRVNEREIWLGILVLLLADLLLLFARGREPVPQP